MVGRRTPKHEIVPLVGAAPRLVTGACQVVEKFAVRKGVMGAGPRVKADLAEAMHERVWEHGDWLCFVAVVEGDVVGVVALEQDATRRTRMHLRCVVVDKAFQGCGLGVRLLGRAEAACVEHGIKFVELRRHVLWSSVAMGTGHVSAGYGDVNDAGAKEMDLSWWEWMRGWRRYVYIIA